MVGGDVAELDRVDQRGLIDEVASLPKKQKIDTDDSGDEYTDTDDDLRMGDTDNIIRSP